MSRPNHLTHFFPLALLLCYCILLYSGTLSHGWHLDDPANILHNNALHISDLHFTTLIKTFFAYPGSTGTFFRPVTNLSFAFNWFFSQEHPYSYHLINICIHYLTAVILFFSCILLLKSPALKSSNIRQKNSIALLVSILWVAAPIHTQAVTYIVQRMAQFATFFSITTICFFLLARLATSRKKRVTFFALTFISTLLAFGSKENSVLLPLSLILIEYIFFSNPASFLSKLTSNKKKTFAILLILLSGSVLILLHYGTGLVNYDHRSFTISERLLTEPRILLFYLSQIFFPSPLNLSIEHDIILSKSLFIPWNTLPALVTCIGLILYSFIRVHKYPLFSFAILFFFLNHIVESTIIPLELLFEHRNYLPSLFLFLPIAALITRLITNINNSNNFRHVFIFATCTGFLILSGISTYERNKVWATEQSLWEDAVAKAPESARAKLNLAKSYIKSRRFEEAFQLCEEAEQFAGASQNNTKPISLNSKGAIAYRRGDAEEALTLFNKALNLRSDYTDVSYKKIQLLIELQRYEEALETTNELFNRIEAPQLLLIKGSLLLQLNKPVESLKTYKKARQLFPHSSPVFAGKGKAISMLGHYEKADNILSIAMTRREPDAPYLRVENYLCWGKDDRATDLLQQLLNSTPLQTLLNDLSAAPPGAFQIPFDRQLIKKQLLSLLSSPMYTSLVTTEKL